MGLSYLRKMKKMKRGKEKKKFDFLKMPLFYYSHTSPVWKKKMTKIGSISHSVKIVKKKKYKLRGYSHQILTFGDNK